MTQETVRPYHSIISHGNKMLNRIFTKRISYTLPNTLNSCSNCTGCTKKMEQKPAPLRLRNYIKYALTGIGLFGAAIAVNYAVGFTANGFTQAGRRKHVYQPYPSIYD